jgi:hypothetical protein
MTSTIYVDVSQTIPDVAVQTAGQSSNDSNLRTTTAILLALLIIVSFVSNLLLIASIVSSHKLRSTILYRLFINLAAINLMDTVVDQFASLLYVANGQWLFGAWFCQLNAFTIQLIDFEAFIGIAVIAIDRSIALLIDQQYSRQITPFRLNCALIAVWLIGICLNVSLLIGIIPVNVYPYRYLCAISSQSPIAYTIALILIYLSIFLVLLVCSALILSRANGRSSPLPIHKSTDDYSTFIRDSRAQHQHVSLGKLALGIFLIYFVLVGPYQLLIAFVQIRNSRELIAANDGNEFMVAEDADTLLTWLKFIYPVAFPLLIFICCSDIWIKVGNLVCCRRSNTVSTSTQQCGDDPDNSTTSKRRKKKDDDADGNVMTLVATAQGLQLRFPQNRIINGNGMTNVETTTDQQLHPNSVKTTSIDVDPVQHHNKEMKSRMPKPTHVISSQR